YAPCHFLARGGAFGGSAQCAVFTVRSGRNVLHAIPRRPVGVVSTPLRPALQQFHVRDRVETGGPAIDPTWRKHHCDISHKPRWSNISPCGAIPPWDAETVGASLGFSEMCR